MLKKYLFTFVLLILLFNCLNKPARSQNFDTVLQLIEDVQKKLKELDNQQKQDVSVKNDQLSQEIEQLRIATQTNTNTIEEIKSQMAPLAEEIEQFKSSFQPKSDNQTDDISILAGNLRTLMAELQRTIGNSSGALSTQQTVKSKEKDESTKSDDFRVYWKNGIPMETADKAFQFKLGARIMNDWFFLSSEDKTGDALGKFKDGVEFRRAWIQLSGIVYNNVEFNAFYGFEGGTASLLDVYIGLIQVPVLGNIRAGHFKEPIGLEQLMSSNDLTFIERSLSHALNPFRNTGIVVQNTAGKKRLTWALGVFRDTDSYGNGTGDGKYNYTARISGLPLYTGGGQNLVHIGASYSRRNPIDKIQYKSRPETHSGPYFVDTKTLIAENVDLINAEIAGVYGRASLQGEYLYTGISSESADNPAFNSFYVMGSYCITGQHRTYKQVGGTIGSITMDKGSYFGSGGAGAWEAVLRYSRLDLTDKAVTGGELSDITFGLNWYLNPNVRIMMNCIRSELKDIGTANAFITRFQFNI